MLSRILRCTCLSAFIAAAIFCIIPTSHALAGGCDPRQDFQYGSGCSLNFTVTPFNPQPGDTVTVTIETSSTCSTTPRKLSLSNALPSVIVDGTPVTGTIGAAGTYDWSPLPAPNQGIVVDVPQDSGAPALHTIIFTIDPNAAASCVQVSGSYATGPWVEFEGDSGFGYWYLAKPLKIGDSYSVTYNGNGSTGGSVPVDDYTYLSGMDVTVLDNTGNLTCSGFTFDGWNTLPNAAGTNYFGGDTFTIGSADVTLYAHWTGGLPAEIGSGTYDSIASAYGAALTSGDTIKVVASNPPETLDFNSDPGKSVALTGGYDCSFSNVVSYSAVTGPLTVSTGDVTIANIVIQ